jgi:excinuclease ABC subunit C
MVPSDSGLENSEAENRGKLTDPPLQAKLAALPGSPGVYLFKDAAGRIIYIGKAKNLRNRVRSYFQSNRTHDPKTRVLSGATRQLDYILTDNEVEALILESTLVKQHQPRFNVRLKDDKAFLHIKLTVNEAYPRVLLTRRIRNDGALYFGPYLPASLARNTIKIINRHFLLRTCSIQIDGSLDRPCLEYYIKRCLAPCVKGLCRRAQYSRAVRDVVLLLQGRNGELIQRLTDSMLEASEKEQFEAAAIFRDRLQLVRSLATRQKMAVMGMEDVDVFAYHRDGPRLALQLFTFRGGRVVGKREFFWEDIEFFQPASFLRDALQQYYLNAGTPPKEIYLPVAIEDQDLIIQWLARKRPHSDRSGVRITAPKRGKKLDFVLLAERNAQIAFDSRFRLLRSETDQILKLLRDELNLPKLPSRIEAFDISNIQGTDPVAALVVCVAGQMKRREYRKFKIKSVSGPDDFASIQEVVHRRYQRLLKRGDQLPDLILIDGGKGQLHAAYQALSQLEIDDTPLASIAKKEELIFVQGHEEAVDLNSSSPALRLTQEIRDEAHRFAVTYHRKRRALRDFSSELDSVPGVGPKRRKRLLQNFGSLSGIRRASVEELTPFVGKKTAEAIRKHLSTRTLS